MTHSQRPSRRRSIFSRSSFLSHALLTCSLAVLFACLGGVARAAVVRGSITDPLGAAIPNARINLMQAGKLVAYTLSRPDGSFEVKCSQQGRFVLAVEERTFSPAVSESFYSGRLDIVVRNIVLHPATVRSQVVVTATGTPTPTAQVSSAVSVVPASEFATRSQILDELRLIPGLNVVQTGQRGGLTSLFVRGGPSDGNKILVDGIPAEDVGGSFDFGTVSSTGLAGFEVYRGPDSVLYGSDAAAGVISLESPRGQTSRPELDYTGDAGNFRTYRNQVALSGVHNKLDYYATFARLNTANALPDDLFHVVTSAANLGWNATGSTQLRFTVRNSVSATGLPAGNAGYDFYGITNNAKQGDQDLYLGGTLDNQTSDQWHNMVRYSATRKREQSSQWYVTGIPVAVTQYGYTSTNYYGNPVTVRGANGYVASGQAVLNYGGSTYPLHYESVNNRDIVYAQSDFRFNPHLIGLLGFSYEDERGAFRYPEYFEDDKLERRNYDYIVQVQGDIKNRLFYSLGGGIEKNYLYGTEGTPRIGLAWYPVRPGKGAFHGTKLRFNFSRGVQEPSLFSQFDSLYGFLVQQGDIQDIQQYNIRPIGAETSRSYEGGVEQSILDEHLLLKAGYFHNEFGNQIEFVGSGTLLANFNVAPAIVEQLNNVLGGADLNSMSYSAQGLETDLELRLFQTLTVRSGYTYLDATVQHSFAGSAVSPAYNPNYPGIPIGASSPLVGARPFRRPPHTGFVEVAYSGRKWAAAFKGAFVGRSDDSTFLAYADLNGGNTMLLPNRNLDYGFSKLDANISRQIWSRLAVFTQMNNLLGEQKIGPIGYPALPFNFTAGLKLRLGGQ
jgi:iron complex outermembrane receptor protein/vitamin B12 transporter